MKREKRIDIDAAVLANVRAASNRKVTREHLVHAIGELTKAQLTNAAAALAWKKRCLAAVKRARRLKERIRHLGRTRVPKTSRSAERMRLEHRLQVAALREAIRDLRSTERRDMRRLAVKANAAFLRRVIRENDAADAAPIGFKRPEAE